MTSLHADARSVLAGWAPPTPRDAALRDRFVAHLDSRPDGMTRDCLPDHLTAGAIVLTPEADAVLLNHHRKVDGWLAFGGHCEPLDATLAGVALREAHEESGLADLDFDAEPLDLDEHAVQFCAPGVTVHHLDVRFLATAPRDAGHRVSEESLDVRWWPVDALPDVFDDMRRLIAVAVARLERRRAQSAASASSSATSSVSLDGGSTLAAADQPSR